VLLALLTWTLAAFVWLLAPAAAADAVPPPPDSCPAGSAGDSCHGGEYCRASGCTSDSDCSGGMACRELELCIGQIDCAGGWDPDAGPSYSPTVEGSCSGGSACSAGSCELRRVCAMPGAGSSSGGEAEGPIEVDQGCGCSLPGTAGAGSLAGLGFVAALGLGLRRRSRR
jgi:MYXO-CTERM domain-containing protein